MLWEILKASKGILVADFYADLWANLAGGGTPVDVFVEMIGSLPLYYNGKGYDLTDYLISGNAVQDGTPSPDAPVDAQGCGVRTEQLFEDKIASCSIDASGRLIGNPDFDMYLAKVEQGETYTASASITGGFFATKPVIGSTSYNEKRMTFAAPTITAPITGYMVFRANSGSAAPMLNTGSTALPYEPYGHKLPLTVNGVEYPIYLGAVPTTRRIKKLVLTGEEAFGYANSCFTYTFDGKPTSVQPIKGVIFSNIYEGVEPRYRDQLRNYQCCITRNYNQIAIRDNNYADATDFKSYLAAQYANGTPVTVWYVLAEPETAVVNEPLMKIGDYADTVSFAQAGVTIPTVSGANVLDMTSTVKPSEMYIKGKGIKPTGYGQLTDVNGVNILDKDGRPIYGRASDRR